MKATSTPAGQATGPSRRLRALSLLWIGLGAFLCLAGLGVIANGSGQPWVIGSFGASAVLLFAYPEGPFSQVRNVIGGHLLTSTVGLVCLHLFGPGLLPMAFAGGLATVLMVVTRTVHPPAGGNPLIVFMTQPGWSFLLVPTLGGACFLMGTALVYWKGIRWLQQAFREPSTEPSMEKPVGRD